MKKNINLFLLILPLIYSIIKLHTDFIFYLTVILLFLVPILKYLFFTLKSVRLWIQLGISYIFLDITFHRIDFISFIKNFRYIDLKIFVLIVLIIYITIFIRSYKWKYLLSHIKKVRILNLFKATLVGFMGNAIFPARLGEILRAFILGKYEKISKLTVFSTIILERIFDGIVVGGFFLYILIFNPLKNPYFIRAGITAGGIYIILIIGIIIFYFRYELFYNFIKHKVKFLSLNYKKKILKFLNSFYAGLHIFDNLKELILFILLTILIWILCAVETYLFLKSMNIFKVFFLPTDFSPIFLSILFAFIMTIGIAIPSGPGAAGPFQASIVFTFVLLLPQTIKDPVKYNYVASFSMYIWGTQIISVVVGGLYVIIRDGIKIKKLQKRKL